MARTKKPSMTVGCYWDRADDDTETWETTCGHVFCFNDGGPRENGFKFCGYCGRPIIAKPATREGRS